MSVRANTEKEVGGVKVAGAVSIIPAKRTAVYDVVLDSKLPPSRAPKIAARVNAKSITFGASGDIPKTLEAVDAIIALATVVREELVGQGIKS